VATRIRLLGDFDLAEECAQEAFAADLDQWPASCVPQFPRAWINGRWSAAGLGYYRRAHCNRDLNDYRLLHAARADLLRRNGSREEAAKSYLRALALVTNDRERGYLQRRLREVQPSES
jgi:predicted RNA polymerase sigma factor